MSKEVKNVEVSITPVFDHTFVAKKLVSAEEAKKIKTVVNLAKVEVTQQSLPIEDKTKSFLGDIKKNIKL